MRWPDCLAGCASLLRSIAMGLPDFLAGCASLPRSALRRLTNSRRRRCAALPAPSPSSPTDTPAERVTRRRIASRIRPILLPDLRIGIADASPVVRVMLPCVGTDCTIAQPVGVDAVGIDTVEPVHVDIDVARSPVRSSPAPERAGDRDTSPEGKPRRQRRSEVIASRRRIVGGRIGRVGPCAVDDGRIVGGHVHRVGLRRLDNDRRDVLRDDLLRVALQGSRRLRSASQRLHRGKHVALLRQECVTQLLCPVELIAHHLQHGREGYQRLHACVPVLPIERLEQCIALQVHVAWLRKPAVRHHHFQRIGRGNQDLGQQIIGI